MLVNSHVTRILVANNSSADEKPHFDSVEFTQDAGSKFFFIFILSGILADNRS